jgi:hypothetical protein
MPWTEEDDILHAIEHGYQFDGLFPQDWCEWLFMDSDLFSDVPAELKVDMIKHLAKDDRFRELILAQLNAYL